MHSMTTNNNNGFNEWKKLIEDKFKKIDDIDGKVDKIFITLAELKTELKLKSGVWGFIGGAIPVLITLAIALVIHFVK